MTIFTDDKSTTATFDPDKVTKSDLVGEGKKYKTDEELARAYAHSDKHIAELKADADAMRKTLAEQTTVTEAIKRLEAQYGKLPEGNGVTTPEPKVESPPQETKGLTPEDVDRIIADRERNQTAAQNMAQVTEAIQKFAGDEVKGKDYVSKRASELGMTPQALGEIGKQSPSALLKLLGLESKTPSPTTVVDRTYRPGTSSASQATPGSLAYYDELKKTDPSKYFSPSNLKKAHELKYAEVRERMAKEGIR